MAEASRDKNNVPSLLGVSSSDLSTPTRISANPTTGALLIDATSLYAGLDPRYVNVTGDSMTGDLTGFFTAQTKAQVLATTPTSTSLAFCSDTKEFMLYDGTVWREASLELKPSATGVDMGAYNDTNGSYSLLGDSDRMGYYNSRIVDKDISFTKLSEAILGDNTYNIVEGSIRVNSSTFQIYLNGVWNDIVLNFRFREDNNGAYELEHKPIGFALWYEVYSGNSNVKALNGLPLIQNYSGDMGAYPKRLLISGRS